MFYLLQVYALVTFVVFGLAGLVLLSMVAWNQAKEYAMAQKAMQRIVNAASPQRRVNSRTVSRSNEQEIRPAA